MVRYDAEAEALQVVGLLGVAVEGGGAGRHAIEVPLAPLIDALRVAQKAGAEEMRERAAGVCDTQPIQDDGSEAAPGPGYERGWLSANARSAHTIRALPTEPGEEAGT